MPDLYRVKIQHRLEVIDAAVRQYLERHKSVTRNFGFFQKDVESPVVIEYELIYRNEAKYYLGSLTDIGSIILRSLGDNATELRIIDSPIRAMSWDYIRHSVESFFGHDILTGEITKVELSEEMIHEVNDHINSVFNTTEKTKEGVIEALKEDGLILAQGEASSTRTVPLQRNQVYVDETRIRELRALKSSSFDLTRLVALCEELNKCYQNECYSATAMIARAIIDHIPPIFGTKTFSEISSNYSGSRSFKESMQHFGNSVRKIADAHLHVQIRSREVLPTRTQVDFSQDLDVLLAEVVRILK